MKFWKSLNCAFNGIRKAFQTERNLRFHFFAAIIVTFSGIILSLSILEWVGIVFSIGLVICAELFNTSIEKLVDLVSPQFDKKAGLVKDISAGAVLFAAIISIIIGLIIFLPKIISFLKFWFN